MQFTRIAIVLVSLLLAAGLIVGCGSSDDDPKPSTDSSTSSDDDSTTTKTTTEDGEEYVVVPGTGIAGVAVGDDEGAVIDALGESDRRTEVPNEFSGGSDDRLEWDSPAMAVVIQQLPTGSEVVQVETTDELVRTANGLGLGDAQSDVVSAHPEAACDAGTIHACRIGREQAGEVVTDFIIKDDVVVRIVVGRIID